MIPQFDPANPQMISQGPSVCIFNKEDPQGGPWRPGFCPVPAFRRGTDGLCGDGRVCAGYQNREGIRRVSGLSVPGR